MQLRIRAHHSALLAAILVTLPEAASARPEYVTAVSRPITINSAVADYASRQVSNWGYRLGMQRFTNEYRVALGFARCVSKFDPTAAEQLLHTPIGEPNDRPALLDLSRQYRGCVVEIGEVAPVLLRAALAEAKLGGAVRARASGDSASVGIPDEILGFRLAEAARCQLVFAPDRVQALLATDPGGKAERDAAEALYQMPECGLTTGLGRIAPTVARLAVIDAAYRGR